jgi:hypothetical protein
VIQLEAQVQARIDGRLVWFGIRDNDAAGVWWDGADVSTHTLVGDGLSGESLDVMTRMRINPDCYELDQDPGPDAELLIQRTAEFARGGVLVPYRPSSRLERTTDGSTLVAAMPSGVQRQIEDKQWVECELRQLAIPTLDWFIAGEGQSAPGASYVVRGVGGGGGTGMRLVDCLADAGRDAVVSRFIEGAIGVNTSGCCFPDGTVSVHLPTVQLIGTPGCTDLPFGYCGNDAAFASSIDPEALSTAARLTEEIGAWLIRTVRWRGAFGLDFVVTGPMVYFCEMNPRFQGSSRLATLAARRSGRPGLHVEHVAAHLGISPTLGEPVGGPSHDWAAQIVLHNLRSVPVVARRRPSGHPDWRLEMFLPEGIQAAPGAPLVRLSGQGPVTADGRELLDDARSAVEHVQACFEPA